MTVDYVEPTPQRFFAVYPSAARTASPHDQQINLSSYGDVDGLVLVVDITAVTATGSVTFKIQGFDPISGQTWDILTSASKTGVTGAGTPLVMRVQNNIPASANVTAQDMVPPFIRITATHGNGVSLTYSAALFLDY